MNKRKYLASSEVLDKVDAAMNNFIFIEDVTKGGTVQQYSERFESARMEALNAARNLVNFLQGREKGN
jgi:hypothetical protein